MEFISRLLLISKTAAIPLFKKWPQQEQLLRQDQSYFRCTIVEAHKFMKAAEDSFQKRTSLMGEKMEQCVRSELTWK